MRSFKPWIKVDHFVVVLEFDGATPVYTVFKGNGFFKDRIRIKPDTKDLSILSPFGEDPDNGRFFINETLDLWYGNPEGPSEEIGIGQVYSVLWKDDGRLIFRDVYMTAVDNLLIGKGYPEFLGNLYMLDDHELGTEDLEMIGDILYDEYVEMNEGEDPVHIAVVNPYETDELRLLVSDDLSDLETLTEICDGVREIVFDSECTVNGLNKESQ